ERAVRGEHLARDVDRALPPRPRTKLDREELGVGEGLGPVPAEALPRALALGPVLDRHPSPSTRTAPARQRFIRPHAQIWIRRPARADGTIGVREGTRCAHSATTSSTTRWGSPTSCAVARSTRESS